MQCGFSSCMRRLCPHAADVSCFPAWREPSKQRRCACCRLLQLAGRHAPTSPQKEIEVCFQSPQEQDAEKAIHDFFSNAIREV